MAELMDRHNYAQGQNKTEYGKQDTHFLYGGSGLAVRFNVLRQRCLQKVRIYSLWLRDHLVHYRRPDRSTTHFSVSIRAS